MNEFKKCCTDQTFLTVQFNIAPKWFYSHIVRAALEQSQCMCAEFAINIRIKSRLQSSWLKFIGCR